MGDTQEYLDAVCESCPYYGTDRCKWETPEECPYADFD